MKEFFQVLGRHKLRHSTSSVTTEMLKDMNKSMMIENTNLELKKTDFAKDEDQRNLIKLLLNSTIGKFASRPRVNTKFVNSKKEFYDVLCTEDVCLAEVLGDVAKLTVKERKKIYSSKGSMVITAYITARTRIMLHKYVMLIANSGYSLYYTDCDSLFFSGPKNQKVPLPVGTSFGDFKEVYKNIVSFSCVGRKRYCVTINEENKKKSVKKISGLALDSMMTKEEVTEETFQDFIQGLEENEIVTKPVLQPKKRRRKNIPEKILIPHKFSNKSLVERKALQRLPTFDTKRIITKPWGYTVY